MTHVGRLNACQWSHLDKTSVSSVFWNHGMFGLNTLINFSDTANSAKEGAHSMPWKNCSCQPCYAWQAIQECWGKLASRQWKKVHSTFASLSPHPPTGSYPALWGKTLWGKMPLLPHLNLWKYCSSIQSPFGGGGGSGLPEGEGRQERAIVSAREQIILCVPLPDNVAEWLLFHLWERIELWGLPLVMITASNYKF